MIILNAHESKMALPMAETIEAMKNAYNFLSSEKAEVPLRTQLSIREHDGITLIMPAYISDKKESALAVKIVSLFDQNPSKGLPLLHAAVIVINNQTGKVEALIEGSTLTAIRTGAGSGAATDLLAQANAKSLAIIGAGVQAATQLEAVCTVRNIAQVRVYAPNQEKLKKFVSAHKGRGAIPNNVEGVEDVSKAIQGADIICTATPSLEAVFEDKDVKEGCHINAVGSFRPEMKEIPFETMARSTVFVDDRFAAGEESGELIDFMKVANIELDQFTEIGEVIMDPSKGRKNDKEITLFKSVGIAVQDAAAGKLALANALKQNLGTRVDL